MPPRSYRKGGKRKASPFPSGSSTVQKRSLSPDDKMSPGSLSKLLTIPSSLLAEASLNPVPDPKDSSLNLSSQDHRASQPSRDSTLASGPFDDLGDTYQDFPSSPNEPSPVETPITSRWRANGWKDVLATSSNLLSNVHWDLTFWKPTNASETMHTLGIEGKDDSKGVVAFWVFGDIEYAALSSLGTYGSWSINLACGDDDIQGLRRNLKTGEY